MSLCDVFLKIGGSILGDEAATTALVPHITALSSRYRILILTGGGQVAKRIKANQRMTGSEFYKFWRATAYCPEVNAYLLASYSPSFEIVSCAAEIAGCFETGNIAVLAPAAAILSSLLLKPDWLVTTDSIGLHFANALGARRYVIVSDVDGIYELKPHHNTRTRPIPRLTVEELEHLPSSKVDAGFPAFFRRYGVPTVIVNGKHPTRVADAICGSPTIGTELVTSPQEGVCA